MVMGDDDDVDEKEVPGQMQSVVMNIQDLKTRSSEDGIEQVDDIKQTQSSSNFGNNKRRLITTIAFVSILYLTALFAMRYRLKVLTTPIRQYNITDSDGNQQACVEYEQQTDCLTLLH
eukprot:scaffold302_cov106-Cylindrotheca_fusiformis.AAC.3